MHGGLSLLLSALAAAARALLQLLSLGVLGTGLQ